MIEMGMDGNMKKQRLVSLIIILVIGIGLIYLLHQAANKIIVASNSEEYQGSEVDLEQKIQSQERESYNIVYGEWEVVRSSRQDGEKYDYVKGQDLTEIDNDTAYLIGTHVTITPEYIEYKKDEEVYRYDTTQIEHRVDTKLDLLELFYYKVNRLANHIDWVKEAIDGKEYYDISGVCFEHPDNFPLSAPKIIVVDFVIVDDQTLIAYSLNNNAVKLKRVAYMENAETYYHQPRISYSQKKICSKAKLGKIGFVEENAGELDQRMNKLYYLAIYGEWEVSKIVAHCDDVCMNKQEINKLIGTDIKIDENWVKINGKIVAKNYETKIDVIPILSENQIYIEGYPTLNELGIKEEYFVYIEIMSCDEEEVYTEPFSKFYVKDETTLIVEEQGYYLELKKVSEPLRSEAFYEFC